LSYNVAVGYNAQSVDAGYMSVSVGAQAHAGYAGSGGIAIGYAASRYCDGTDTIAIGRYCNDAGGNTSNYSVYIGGSSGGAVTSGHNNVCVGYQSGDVITTGGSNILIGYGTDPSANDSTNQIVIGISIAGGVDNQFTFGKASNVVQNEFDTDANWTRTSDIRKKRDIKDDTLGLDFINDLRTVTHKWKPSNAFPKEWDEYSEENNMNLEATMHGMIAQEVKEALDKAGVDTFSGWKERKDGSQTVSREMFVIPLIKSVQELSEQVKEQKKEIEELKNKI
jgi:hypothetical protein